MNNLEFHTVNLPLIETWYRNYAKFLMICHMGWNLKVGSTVYNVHAVYDFCEWYIYIEWRNLHFEDNIHFVNNQIQFEKTVPNYKLFIIINQLH